MFLSAITQHLDDACRRIASGRAAARELSALVEGFDLKEAELRLLWILLAGDERHQAQLAEALGCSPAQMSSLVERQRLRGNITGQTATSDRRRQVWNITPQGRALLEKVIAPLFIDHPLRVPTARRTSA